MRKLIVLVSALMTLGAAPADAAPAESAPFAVQHIEVTIPFLNPCTGAVTSLTIVEDFFFRTDADGSLRGIISATVTTADGFDNGGPRVVGTVVRSVGAETVVFRTVQNDRLANDAGDVIQVHINHHVVVVDGEPVVSNDWPRFTCLLTA